MYLHGAIRLALAQLCSIIYGYAKDEVCFVGWLHKLLLQTHRERSVRRLQGNMDGANA